MSGTNAQPAGWYPAPGDPTSERYWDGTAWTASFRPVGGRTPAAPTGTPKGSADMPFYKRRGVQITAGVVIVLAFFGSLLEEVPPTEPAGSETAATEIAPAPAPAPAPTPEPAPAPAPAPAPEPEPALAPAPAAPSDLPADQQAFIALIREYEAIYDEAETDLQRANVRVQRRQALCDLIPSRTISNWIGEVDTIGGNSDGDAYIDLEIADGINIGTWNNRLSDLFDDTLVLATDPLYDTLLALTEGTRVVFTGEFMESTDECMRTSNLTEVFDMARPDFKFRFSAVAPG